MDLETRADETTRRAALLVATLSSFLSPFMMSSVNVALPTIARELRMGAKLLTLVPLTYVLAGAVFLLPLGKVADIHGRKKVFTYGVALFAASSVLSALATSGVMLILLRAFQGVGGAIMFGVAVAILMSVFPPWETGRVLGLTVGAVYVGLSVGPFVGGFLTEQLGWRSLFLLSGLLGAAVLGATLWKLKGEWAEAEGERLDIVGSAVYCFALMAAMYGLQLVPTRAGFFFLCLGAAGFCLFAKWEMRVEHPVLDWSLFRGNRVFSLSNLAMFINYGATYAIGFLISLYLQYSKHLNPQSAGLIMMAQPVVQAAVSPYAGKLSDRVEPQVVASCGMGLTVIGLGLFAGLTGGTATWFVAAVLALHGLGFGLFSSPNTNAVMGSVEKRFYGVASGIASTMRLLGNSFSIGTVMVVFSLYVGEVQITPDRYPAFLTGLRVIFVIFALFCGGGVFASLARGKMRQGRGSPG
jgi:EmrB/QacA subfamily drug resistance transporter